MNGSDEGFKPKHEKTKYFSCRRCRTLDLNDFRFLHNFIELKWLGGIIGESVDTKVAGSIPGRKIFLILQLWQPNRDKYIYTYILFGKVILMKALAETFTSMCFF